MVPGVNSDDAPAPLSLELVLRELESILASSGFVNSPQLSRFLRYTVEQTVQGNSDRLKEYQIGVDVFGRAPSYDTRTDPVVRVQARQLRFKLAGYYAGPGVSDELIISLPKGGYMAHFELRTEQPVVIQHDHEPAPPHPDTPVPQVAPDAIRERPWIWWAVAVGVLCLTLGSMFLLVYRRKHAAPGNSEARELYLQGRFYWNKRTPEDLNRSIDLFTQAVVNDPQFAPAYVGLADAYNLLSEFGTMPYKEAFSRALEAARQAVRLDGSSAEAHRALAFAAFYGAFDGRLAEREFKRALELNPNDATAHHWYATFLMTIGRSAEALRQINEAQNLDPDSVSTIADKDLILFYGGQPGQGFRLLKQLEASEPNFPSPHWYLAEVYMERGDYTEFLSELRQGGDIAREAETVAVADAGAKGYAKGGSRGMFQAMLNVQEMSKPTGHSRFYDMAALCSLMGDKPGALDYLHKSFDEREPAILSLPYDAKFKGLHGDTGFEQLLVQIKSKTRTG